MTELSERPADRLRRALSHPPSVIHALGPGLVTGAADDDPSGIATYSQVGAQFGYAMGWTMLFSWPLMAAIQEVSARIGLVSGRGIAANLRRHYPPAVLRVTVVLLVVANVINLGADIGAMGAAVRLLVGGSEHLWALLAGVLCVVLEVFVSYHRYAAFLKWLTLSLFAYVATAFAADVDWSQALRGASIPGIGAGAASWAALVAVLGTTISPYLFFWQSSQEIEERRDHGGKPLLLARMQAPAEWRRVRVDTWVGMAFSNTIALFIIVTTAATLHAGGITDIQTSEQAALALRPLAGEFAFALFAAGIVGTGLLAVPVLAGSAAYAIGEALGWTVGLGRKPAEARSFYGALALATLIGLALGFTPIDPMRALYWSAVVNGVLAAPLMALMMRMATDPRIMGRLALPLGLRIVGWVATAAMFATIIGLAISAV